MLCLERHRKRVDRLNDHAYGQVAGTKHPRPPSGPRRLLNPLHAGVAELADAQDLKSWVLKWTCGFDPRPRHQVPKAF